MSKRVLETSLHLEEAVGLEAGLGGAAAEGEGGGEVTGELDVGGEGGGAEVGEVVGREAAGNGGGGQGAVVENVGEHVGGEEEAGVVEGGGALRHLRRGYRRVTRSGALWGERGWAGFYGGSRGELNVLRRVAFCACVLTWQHFPSNGNIPRQRVRFRTN